MFHWYDPLLVVCQQEERGRGLLHSGPSMDDSYDNRSKKATEKSIARVTAAKDSLSVRCASHRSLVFGRSSAASRVLSAASDCLFLRVCWGGVPDASVPNQVLRKKVSVAATKKMPWRKAGSRFASDTDGAAPCTHPFVTPHLRAALTVFLPGRCRVASSAQVPPGSLPRGCGDGLLQASAEYTTPPLGSEFPCLP